MILFLMLMLWGADMNNKWECKVCGTIITSEKRPPKCACGNKSLTTLSIEYDDKKMSEKEAQKKLKEETSKDRVVLLSRFNPVIYAKQIEEESKLIYDKHKNFWRYDSEEGIWRSDAEQFIKTYLRNNLMGDEQQKKHYVEEVVSFLKDSTYDEKFEPETKVNLIAFKNKIYDLEKDKFLKFSPDYFITNKIDIKIDEKIKDCKVIDKFFVDCVGEEYKKTLYELASYTLFRGCPYQKLFFVCGKANTGKSKFLSLLERFVGKENHSMVEPQNIQLDKHAMSLMWLKLANIVSDINYDSLDNINLIKKLTGEDSVHIRKMYQEGFNETLYAKQIFSTNKLPAIKEKTNAWYRRVYIIPFENEVKKGKQDPFILEKMCEEKQMQGFAYQCIRYLRELYLNNFVFSIDIDTEKIGEVYEELSNPMLRFINENCVEGIEESVYNYDFRERLNNWLKSNHFPSMTSTQINQYMREKYSESNRPAPNNSGKIYRVWVGLRWQKESEISFNQSYHFNDLIKRVYIYRKSFENPSKMVKMVKGKINEFNGKKDKPFVGLEVCRKCGKKNTTTVNEDGYICRKCWGELK